MQQGTSVNRYNGDGALVQSDQVAYTQDLASSLSKVLQINDGTHRINYIYGHERLLSDAAGSEWYATDALGSLRFTLNDDGLATSGTTYDPFGQRERGTIATFGFTGELQDANSDNVYLRARWYNPSHGAFMAQDPFGGFDTLPYSMHPYQYAYSNPGLFTDPSGRCVPGEIPVGDFGSIPIPFAEADCEITGELDWESGGKALSAIAEPATEIIDAAYQDISRSPSERFDDYIDHISRYNPILGGLDGDPLGVIPFGPTNARYAVDFTQGAWNSISSTVEDLSCGDPYRLLSGLSTIAVTLASQSALARITRTSPTTRTPPAQSDSHLILATQRISKDSPLGHNYIGVKRSGQAPEYFHQRIRGASQENVKEVYQLVRGGQGTITRTIRKENIKDARFEIITVTEDQANAAYTTARKLTASTEPYNILTNSCTTTCIQVLEAAGLKPPVWARTPALLELWLKSQQ